MDQVKLQIGELSASEHRAVQSALTVYEKRIRALPLPSQPEDSSARGVVVPGEPTEEMLKAGYTRLTLREKYKAMLAAAPQQNAAPVSERGRWIRATDRLPDLGETVIVHGGIAYRKHPDGAWFTLTGETYPGRPIQWEVTHWQPLPTLPAERD